MKAVLISIQPKWCELIANGKKTVEVRKTKPKLETPFKCYIYCTKNKDKRIDSWLNLYCDSREVTTDVKLEEPCYQLNGKVIGEFVCDLIENSDRLTPLISQFIHDSCLSLNDLGNYAGKNNAELFFWHISDLVIYDKPKELSEFFYVCKHPKGTDCSFCIDHRENECKSIKRPPQSWCYVEELG